MRREEFLSQFWLPYPAAPRACQSISRWQLSPKPGWVGGILSWRDAAAAEGGELLLTSATESLQVQWQLPFIFCKSADDQGEPLAQMAVSHILQPGDQVAVCLEKSAGQTWMASKLMLLTPAIKERPRSSLHQPQKWSQFLGQVRNTLQQLGLNEVSTPTLVVCPGLEPSLEPFATHFKMGPRLLDSVYLPTSPEIHLKKAMALGHTDIFEIKTCFRNGEVGQHHQPEFHMLEWYRGFSDLNSIEQDLSDLLKALGVEKPISKTTFSELFLKSFNFHLTPQTTREDLQSLAGDLKIEVLESDSWNDIFHRILIDKLEPAMATMGPLLVKNFPPSMAALARIGSQGWADRFEFYWKGFEIANAFHEVNDPKEQSKRWDVEQKEREHFGTSKLPVDQQMLEHFKMGFPPTGGVALGLERLFMALHDIQDIRETRLFPYVPQVPHA